MSLCLGCGQEFSPGRSNQIYCERTCQKHAARTAQRGSRATTFVGVDGEGWTDSEGNHRYSQLSVGDRTLFGSKHLDVLEIFAFLWECFEAQPSAAFVGFYLGYDFSQWFRTLPEDRARMLLSPQGIASRRRTGSGRNTVPFPVRMGEWEFDLLGMKRFKLRKLGTKKWMYVCDTGPFFQASFMSVINPKKWPDGSPCTPEEYAVIEEGKSHRADDWTEATWMAAEPDLTRYNVAENTVLAKVMGRYEEGLRAFGVQLDRDQWYGPGQAASAWMDSIGLTKRETLEPVIGKDVFDFAQQSYYGGRFEVFVHGHVPGVSYEYDINSAYPFAMSQMPEWGECEFEWVTGTLTWEDVESGLALVDVTTRGTSDIAGGLPHRTRRGAILFPQVTRGVRWNFEVTAAMSCGFVDDVEVHGALLIRPGVGSVLNGAIPEIYQHRLRVGKETSAGKAAKLVYNSAYGKQAQSIGSPKFSNPLSASYITSHCRTMILNAVSTHPERSASLLMIATDGVYFRSPHPGLDLSETELGKWSTSTKSNLTIVMPGVYYDDRARSHGFAAVKSRGIPAAGLAAAIGSLDAGFSTLVNDPTRSGNWPELRVPIKFKVKTPRSALNEGKWERAGSVERDIERNLSSDPTSKRVGPEDMVDMLFGGDRLPYVDAGGVVRTFPYVQHDTVQSTPYSKTFGIAADDDYDGLSPDGSFGQQLIDYLQGE